MFKAFILAAGLAVVTVSAQAATMKAVFDSVITSNDGTGLGGYAVNIGDPITTTYLYDTSLGTRKKGSTFDFLGCAAAVKSVGVAFKG